MTTGELRKLVLIRFHLIVNALKTGQQEAFERFPLLEVEEAIACDQTAAQEVAVMIAAKAHGIILGDTELAETVRLCHALVRDRLETLKRRN